MRMWVIDQFSLRDEAGDKILLTKIDCIQMPVQMYVSEFEKWRHEKFKEIHTALRKAEEKK